VVAAEAVVPAFAQNAGAPGDDAADQGIGVSVQAAAFGQIERANHVEGIFGTKHGRGSNGKAKKERIDVA
jgi:hypothetical protein